MNAFNETDLIDSFCDLWEACEILCPKHSQNRGKIDTRIAKVLGRHTGFNHHLLRTTVISNLYHIRKDIVHTAAENLQAIGAKHPLLFDIATMLYASRIGARYNGKGA